VDILQFKTTKINTSGSFGVNYAGSESNVASSLGVLGNDVSYITKLPTNELGDTANSSLRTYGINISNIIRGGYRIGTYFIELGASIRPFRVIYDRKNSSLSEIKKDEFNWEAILRNKKWVFLSGITLVLSKQCAEETIKVSEIAKQLGVKVAFDMNYRRSLWNDILDARKIFDSILENTDLLFGNADVLKDVYNISPSNNNNLDNTIEVANIASERFRINQIAFTVRQHISASNTKVSGLFLSDSEHHITKKH
jgi:2-dehydro-3-deoxygluconokinase